MEQHPQSETIETADEHERTHDNSKVSAATYDYCDPAVPAVLMEPPLCSRKGEAVQRAWAVATASLASGHSSFVRGYAREISGEARPGSLPPSFT